MTDTNDRDPLDAPHGKPPRTHIKLVGDTERGGWVCANCHSVIDEQQDVCLVCGAVREEASDEH